MTYSSPWRCLDCGASLPTQDDICEACHSTIVEQSVIDLDFIMSRDNVVDREAQEHKRSVMRQRRVDADENLRQWRARLMRNSRS